MKITKRRWEALALIWGVVIAMSIAHAADPPKLHDCVIEPRSTVALGSPAEGILAEIFVSKGDKVSEGMPLARLDAEMEEITAELARAKAENKADLDSRREQLAFRRKELERLKSMHAKKSASERDYDQAVVERRLAQFSLESARVQYEITKIEHRRAQAMLRRREIHAPLDGVIVDIAMSPGEYVHEQSVLLSVAELDPLYVEVFLPVSEYGTVTTGMLAEVSPEQPIGGTYSAQVVVVDRLFDAASRTFGVRLELANKDYKLPAGLRCTLKYPATDETEKGANEVPGAM